jgi:hypothetical protein
MDGRRSRFTSALLAILSIGAGAAPMTCPPPDKIALTASFLGWWDPQYQYDNPKLVFASVSFAPPELIQCRYRVEGGGLVRLHRNAACAPGSGSWKEQGAGFRCDGPDISACALECKP